jgi:hypothetical protein
MEDQKDRRLESPGEANRDKHINFLAAENGELDPATNDQSSDADDTGEDNGFFTDDDNRLQTKEEYEEDKSNYPNKSEKVEPLSESTAETLGNKITVNSANEDILTPVVDDDKELPYEQGEDDQAH